MIDFLREDDGEDTIPHGHITSLVRIDKDLNLKYFEFYLRLFDEHIVGLV